MTNDMMNLTIPEDTIRPIIENQIKAGIVRELNKHGEMISMVVNTVMSERVDENGNKPRYSSDDKYDYMEFLIRDGIKKVADEALKEWVAENNKKIKAKVIEELNKPSQQKKIAKGYLDAINESLTCSWNMKCDISFKENRDY
jgi:soluble P-type ATPase